MTSKDLSRHIAIDIGVRALGLRLSAHLDAAFIHQRFSRLVVDCNRDPASADAAPEISDGTTIPGNLGLEGDPRRRRIAAIHAPYQDAIAAAVADRRRSGRETVLIALHSFTPRMSGFARPWEIGVLHGGGDETFALDLLARLRREAGLVVGDNEPYRMDGTDHTIPRHAFPNGLPYAELEVRQDLIADEEGVERWAGLLHRVLQQMA